MKIKVIEPVIINDKSKIIEQERYIREYINKETDIDFDIIKFGFESIESELHVAFNTPEIILKAKEAEKKGYDGIFINCFDDPGVYPIREAVNIPVFGGYIPSIVTASSLGERIGIITTDKNGVISENRKANLCGYHNKIVTIKSIDLGVLELNNKEILLERLINICDEVVKNEKIDVLVFGCTAMHYIVRELRRYLKTKKYNITVIEPLAVGIKYLENIIQLGFTNTLSYKIDINSLTWYK